MCPVQTSFLKKSKRQVKQLDSHVTGPNDDSGISRRLRRQNLRVGRIWLYHYEQYVLQTIIFGCVPHPQSMRKAECFVTFVQAAATRATATVARSQPPSPSRLSQPPPRSSHLDSKSV